MLKKTGIQFGTEFGIKSGMEFRMFGKSEMVKKITARGVVALLAAALMMGVTSYPGRTAYAEPDDGYQSDDIQGSDDEGSEGDGIEGSDNDGYEGDDIEGSDNDGYESGDDDASQDSYRTEYDHVENEDGTWTLIETYYEDGVKTGSKEETRSTDGSQTVTVSKDAEGNVTETTTETRTYNEEGDLVKEEAVTVDGNGKLLMESVTDIHEDGSRTEIEMYYDEDGQKLGSEETTYVDGMAVETVSKDADGNVTEKVTNTVETDADGNTINTETIYDGDSNVKRKTVETMGADSYSQVITDGDGKVLNAITSTVTTDADGNKTRVATETDGDGNMLNYEETRWDADGNVIGTVQGYTITDADGNVTWYSREKDGDGNTIKSYMSEKDASGTLVREEETVYAEDGSRTVATTEYDANGNKTGITEDTYDENGIGKKTVTKDVNGNVVKTETSKSEDDGNGNYTFTHMIYDAEGNLQEETVTTMNFNTGDMTIVSTDADGRSQSITYNGAERFFSQVDATGVQESEVTGFTLDLAKAVCTAEELSAYEAGSALSLRLETKKEEVAASADAAAVKNKLQEQGISMTGAQYFDISLYKGIAANIADKPVETKVTDTGSRQISFVLEVPEDMRNQDSNIIRTFYVLRVHDGAADVLAQGTGDQISVSSSLFSTYVIAYHDEKVGQDDDDDEDDEDDDVAVSNAAGSAANQAGQTVYITSPKTGEETQAGMWMWVVLIGTAGILVCKGKMFLFTKSHSKK